MYKFSFTFPCSLATVNYFSKNTIFEIINCHFFCKIVTKSLFNLEFRFLKNVHVRKNWCQLRLSKSHVKIENIKVYLYFHLLEQNKMGAYSKPFECKNCNKQFSSKEKLDLNKRQHVIRTCGICKIHFQYIFGCHEISHANTSTYEHMRIRVQMQNLSFFE